MNPTPELIRVHVKLLQARRRFNVSWYPEYLSPFFPLTFLSISILSNKIKLSHCSYVFPVKWDCQVVNTVAKTCHKCCHKTESIYQSVISDCDGMGLEITCNQFLIIQQLMTIRDDSLGDDSLCRICWRFVSWAGLMWVCAMCHDGGARDESILIYLIKHPYLVSFHWDDITKQNICDLKPRLCF